MGVSIFKTIRSPVIKIMYLLLAVSFFIGFGILGSLSFKPGLPEIKIGDSKVKYDEFMLVMKDMGGEDLPEETRAMRAFDMLVLRKAISSLMENEMKINIDKTSIFGILASPAGIRSRQDYNNLLRSLGVTQSSFENYLVDSYLFAKLQDIIVRVETAGDFTEFQNFVTRYLGSRQLSIAEIDKSKFSVKYHEKEMKKYYLINQHEFKVPEKREFWIAKFSSEEKARSFFDENKNTKFQSFEEFEKIVANKEGKATTTIIGKERGVQDLQLAPFFAVPEGTISPPLQARDEWWIVHVNKVFPENIMSFEEALPKIKQRFYTEQVKNELRKIISQKNLDSLDEFERFISKYSENIYRETIPIHLDFYPHIGVQQELTPYLSIEKEDFVFPIPVENKDKVFVVFIGKFFPAPEEKFSQMLISDVERIIQGIVASYLPRIKVKPASKEEAIKKLTGM